MGSESNESGLTVTPLYFELGKNPCHYQCHMYYTIDGTYVCVESILLYYYYVQVKSVYYIFCRSIYC